MYEDMRCLVTGGAGFIGSELVKQLVQNRAEVTVLDDFSSGLRENLRGLRAIVMYGDIRDEDFVRKVVHDQEVIFHLAARPFIPSCYLRPKEFFEINAVGTLNLLLAARDYDPEIFVNVSSSEVYGTAQYVPMDEKHPTFPHSTYAVSKLAADRLCYTIFKEQNLPIVIVRPFNTYGPKETHPYIVPTIISQFAKGNRLKLGNLSTSRDLTFVSDTVNALLLAGKAKNAIGETINIGTEKDVSIKELLELIAKIMNIEEYEVELDPRKLRPHDVEKLVASNKKAKEILAWMPKTSLQEGLKKTVDWFMSNNRQWPWELSYLYNGDNEEL
ncbi:MAG: GDP-mannose 4,6-dehydratase [Candidatus Wukongarchaeota archaeon]|nr:GDP-mannose 4,6-dehydratase [Candidatus Wukongarchaeota archaeon]